MEQATFERLRMIREAVNESSIDAGRVIIIPFPVNLPERWRYYVPRDVVHYVRVFSAWEQTKVDRLRDAGYEAEILQPGITKEIEATDVRRMLDTGGDWESMVPAGVARVLREMRDVHAE